jgi:hypothetical protein
MGNASFVSGNGAGAKGCIKEGILGVAYVSATGGPCRASCADKGQRSSSTELVLIRRVQLISLLDTIPWLDRHASASSFVNGFGIAPTFR